MNHRACRAVLGLGLGLVLALATGCGAGRRVTSVYAAPFPEGPRSPVAAAHPKRGEIALSRIAAEIPRKLPTNPPQHCGVGAVVHITFSDGKSVTYGPCTRPASIEHLRLALNRLAPPAATPAGLGTRTVAPTTRAAAIEKMWRANLRSGAFAAPTNRFRNLAPATFNVRLRQAASRYHFTVVKVQILHPRQQAPLVVVETEDKHALAASTAAVLHLIDPKARSNDDRTGWAYEGFLFEARDSHGVPFLATFNWWRGPHAGGGQWAADPSLYPFNHG